MLFRFGGQIFLGDARGLFQNGLLLQKRQNSADHQFFSGLVFRAQLAAQGVGHDIGGNALATVGLGFNQLGHGNIIFTGHFNQTVLGFHQKRLQKRVGQFGIQRDLVGRRIQHIRPLFFHVRGGLDLVAGIHDDVITAGNLVNRAGK